MIVAHSPLRRRRAAAPGSALPFALAGALLLAGLWACPAAAAQGGQAPQALLDAAWNAADWPSVLAILDTMGESEAALARKHRARMSYGWELLAAGRCKDAHAQFELALGLLPGDAQARRGLDMARQRCPQEVLAAPAPAAPASTAPVAATPPAAITPQPVSAPIQVTVQRGDTLYSLARRYGLSVAELQQANGLTGEALQAGQTLTIPPPSGATTPSATPVTAVPSGQAPTVHVVQRGETLYSLARRYGTTVLALQAANQLADDAIWVGQRLVIPPGSASAPGAPTPRTHRVSQGDTLYSLARRYGTTVEAIQAANSLRGTDILVGTLLIIP